MDITQEKQFLEELRQSTLPLQVVAYGKFTDKQYPLDYAYGLMIGAGLTRCECGIWGNIDDLKKDGLPIPCPHITEERSRARFVDLQRRAALSPQD